MCFFFVKDQPFFVNHDMTAIFREEKKILKAKWGCDFEKFDYDVGQQVYD